MMDRVSYWTFGPSYTSWKYPLLHGWCGNAFAWVCDTVTLCFCPPEIYLYMFLSKAVTHVVVWKQGRLQIQIGGIGFRHGCRTHNIKLSKPQCKFDKSFVLEKCSRVGRTVLCSALGSIQGSIGFIAATEIRCFQGQQQNHVQFNTYVQYTGIGLMSFVNILPWHSGFLMYQSAYQCAVKSCSVLGSSTGCSGWWSCMWYCQ